MVRQMTPSKRTSLVSALREALLEPEKPRQEPQLKLERRRGRDGIWRSVLTGRQKTIHECIERYWSLVDKRSPDECWPWTGTTAKGGWGYGSIYFYGEHIPSHRLAYIIRHLEDPFPFFVCHKCDNPCCQNPDHYFLGTHIQNMGDMREKGRAVKGRGELHNKAVLTEEKVRQIRQYIKDQGSAKGLLVRFAIHYGISTSSMWSIFKGHSWKSVTV